MLKNDIVSRHPLRTLGNELKGFLDPGEFGAILARAGLGKTSLLTQIALDGLFREKKVLHISIGDPVRKVCLWYEEVFRKVMNHYGEKGSQSDLLWESILSHRLIMTFNVEGFSVPKFEERLSDLTEQNVFLPDMILIDGLMFDDDAISGILEDMKKLAEKNRVGIWFTVCTHRHEKKDDQGFPVSFSNIADFFDITFRIRPEGKLMNLEILKKGLEEKKRENEIKGKLSLDPASLLMVNGQAE